jgi:DNA-binding NarL/FixJ family response regulator
MSEFIYRTVNVQTGEIVDRPFTEKELEQHKKDMEKANVIMEEQMAKAKARQSALAKLVDLGLTEEEIAAL